MPVPTNPIAFLIAAIRSRVALNCKVINPKTDKPYDSKWCHQTYAPKGSAHGVKGLFLMAVESDALKFPKAIKDAAAAMDKYSPNVALWVATVRAASDAGKVIERQFSSQWKIAVVEDLPARTAKVAKTVSKSDLAAELEVA